MEKKVIECHREYGNCSQCILRSAKIYFNLPISEDAISMCNAVNTGFGVGAFCCALIAGVMVFGLVADEVTAKSMRMELLSAFHEKYGGFSCAILKTGQGGENDCQEILEFTAKLVQEIIESQSQ